MDWNRVQHNSELVRYLDSIIQVYIMFVRSVNIEHSLA